MHTYIQTTGEMWGTDLPFAKHATSMAMCLPFANFDEAINR